MAGCVSFPSEGTLTAFKNGERLGSVSRPDVLGLSQGGQWMWCTDLRHKDDTVEIRAAESQAQLEVLAQAHPHDPGFQTVFFPGSPGYALDPPAQVPLELIGRAHTRGTRGVPTSTLGKPEGGAPLPSGWTRQAVVGYTRKRRAVCAGRGGLGQRQRSSSAHVQGAHGAH